MAKDYASRIDEITSEVNGKIYTADLGDIRDASPVAADNIEAIVAEARPDDSDYRSGDRFDMMVTYYGQHADGPAEITRGEDGKIIVEYSGKDVDGADVSTRLEIATDSDGKPYVESVETESVGDTTTITTREVFSPDGSLVERDETHMDKEGTIEVERHMEISDGTVEERAYYVEPNGDTTIVETLYDSNGFSTVEAQTDGEISEVRETYYGSGPLLEQTESGEWRPIPDSLSEARTEIVSSGDTIHTTEERVTIEPGKYFGTEEAFVSRVEISSDITQERMPNGFMQTVDGTETRIETTTDKDGEHVSITEVTYTRDEDSITREETRDGVLRETIVYDANGEFLGRESYDSDGRLQSSEVLEEDGFMKHVDYDKDGHITEVTLEKENVFVVEKYEYNAENDTYRCEVTGTETGDGYESRSSHSTYIRDGNGEVIEILASNIPGDIRDEDGNLIQSVSYECNPDGTVLCEVTTYSEDGEGKVTLDIRDAQGLILETLARDIPESEYDRDTFIEKATMETGPDGIESPENISDIEKTPDGEQPEEDGRDSEQQEQPETPDDISDSDKEQFNFDDTDSGDGSD